MSSSHCKNKMRLKDKKLLIFSTINCFLFVIFFLKSGGYYLTESSSIETSIEIVNITPAPIVVKPTKQVIPAFTGDVIANDLYQKYLGKILLIRNARFITCISFSSLNNQLRIPNFCDDLFVYLFFEYFYQASMF